MTNICQLFVLNIRLTFSRYCGQITFYRDQCSVFFLLTFSVKHTSRCWIGVGGLSPRCVSVSYLGQRSISIKHLWKIHTNINWFVNSVVIIFSRFDTKVSSMSRKTILLNCLVTFKYVIFLFPFINNFKTESYSILLKHK